MPKKVLKQNNQECKKKKKKYNPLTKKDVRKKEDLKPQSQPGPAAG